MSRYRDASKVRVIILAIFVLAAGSSCLFTSAGVEPAAPTGQNIAPNAQPAAEVVLPTLANGWKQSRDASGACQVATPTDWQPGKDFFLAADKTDPGPFKDHPGSFPPSGAALWKDNPGLKGHYFQSRRTLTVGDLVCSVWRIQADTKFTDAQERELDEVGKTLQAVQK